MNLGSTFNLEKNKKRLVVYLPRRLYRILEEISPTFLDLEAENPSRGVIGKALEHILQQYMESPDYLNKMTFIKNMRWKTFIYLSEKEHELMEKSKEKQESTRT